MDDYLELEKYIVEHQADHYRDDIVAILNGNGQTFNKVLFMFMNGDCEPIHVTAQQGKLSLTYSHEHHGKYEMRDNILVRFNRDIDGLVYHLVRFLDPHWIKTVLNANKDILESHFARFIPDDSDRGYEPMIIYRLGGDFETILPNDEGDYTIDRSFVEQLVPFSDYENVDDLIDDGLISFA